jgi:NADH-quinone oxidoreductase subunit F
MAVALAAFTTSAVRTRKGTQDDIDKLLDICGSISGRSFCPLGDGATSCVTSAVQYFREEFEAGMHTPAAELFPPAASTLFAKETVSA